jgi:hypothetical protein
VLLSICSSPVWVPAGCIGIAWQLVGFKQKIVTKEYLDTKLQEFATKDYLDTKLQPLYIMQALTVLFIAKVAFVASPPPPHPLPSPSSSSL